MLADVDFASPAISEAAFTGVHVNFGDVRNFMPVLDNGLRVSMNLEISPAVTLT